MGPQVMRQTFMGRDVIGRVVNGLSILLVELTMDQISMGYNVCDANFHLAKCLWGKFSWGIMSTSPRGEMSMGQIVQGAMICPWGDL